jgi:uncharacterized protein (TIGR02757 family)
VRPTPISPETAAHLEALYDRYTKRKYVHPDPLWPVYRYEDRLDQEIVALISATLAFGNVKQILDRIEVVLWKLTAPREDLLRNSPNTLWKTFKGFRHRFVRDTEFVDLLLSMRRMLRAHGTMGGCFAKMVHPGDTTVLPALERFVAELRTGSNLDKNYLLPDPTKGSACKRLLLWLRWMIRKDNVDLGAWQGIDKALLVVPLDTHLHRISLQMGLTKRKSADIRTALEITEAFRTIAPEDPVRYDFALTRLGIREDLNSTDFLAGCIERV